MITERSWLLLMICGRISLVGWDLGVFMCRCTLDNVYFGVLEVNFGLDLF
jgi:hypothetical protein